MKILIADDEKYIRYGLKSMLKELYTDVDIKEAVNGEEIIEVVKYWHPDIGLIDIKMPKLNGLEAIKIAKKITPETKWVILTTYSKFSYAKEAITLDTEEYLLKPVKPVDLSESIDKIISKQEKEYESQNKEYENSLNSFFNGLYSPVENQYLNDYVFYGTVVYFDISPLEESRKELYNSFCVNLSKINKNCISGQLKTAVINLAYGELAVIAALKNFDEESNSKIFSYYFEKITLLAKNFNTHRSRITLLFTNRTETIETLKNSIFSLRELSHLRIVTGIGHTLRLNNKVENNLKQLSSFSRIIKNILISYRNNSFLNIFKNIDSLKTEFSNIYNYLDSQSKKSIRTFLHIVFNFSKVEIDEQGKWIEQLSGWLEKQMLRDNTPENKNSIINRALAYIDNNYRENIGVADIALILKITPNYLSHLFHKHTGITFNKHLTKIRMCKAKELLLTNSIKIHEAASQVGYTSSTHFTKLFKKYWGCLPSELNNS